MIKPVQAALVLTAILVFGSAIPASASASASASVDETAVVRPEEGEVFRLYRSALGRSPDSEGFGYWTAARIEGLSLRAIADGFLNSVEYARRFGGGSNAEFLDRVYNNVLGRPGEPAGVAYWSAEMDDGLQRTELVLLFSESIEHQNRTGTAPPDLAAFQPVITTVTASDLVTSWRSGCPVDPADLRALEIDHVDFDGDHRRGILIVNADVADELLSVFEALYNARYPIASIRPIDEFAADDDASMAANNTSGFNCRVVTGGSSWSGHSYGRAIDINPAQNPYVAGQLVLPPDAADYVDRAIYHPAMIRPGDVVTAAFADAGWRWGGAFRSLRDYQHFDR